VLYSHVETMMLVAALILVSLPIRAVYTNCIWNSGYGTDVRGAIGLSQLHCSGGFHV